MDADEFEEGEGDPAVARIALTIALAGLAPFAVIPLWLIGIDAAHPWWTPAIMLLTGYGALILSFLGGIRWGLAIAGRAAHGRRDIAIGAVPALVGWAALAIPAPQTFAVLAVAFAAHGAWDSLAVHSGRAPRWFGRLRILMTLPAVGALVAAFAATG